MNRLFNHKPFIFGEIRFIVKEFEQIRDESDLNQLMEIYKRFTDFNETKMDFVVDLCQQFNDRLNGSIDSVDNLMKEILSIESEQSIHRNDVLKTKREDRNQQMIGLIEESKLRITQIDSQFEEQENNLRLFYKELETKLKIN